jgi:hypothetical protein
MAIAQDFSTSVLTPLWLCWLAVSPALKATAISKLFLVDNHAPIACSSIRRPRRQY